MDKRTGKRTKNTRSRAVSQHDLDALFLQFIHAKTAEGLSVKTLDNYHLYYRYFCDYLDHCSVSRDVRNVTATLVREYTAWLLNEKTRFGEEHKYKGEHEKTTGLRPSTVNTRIKVLRTFFKFLYDEQLIDDNPLARVKKVEGGDSTIKIMTVEQLKKLMSAPDQRTYAGFRDYVLMSVLLDGFMRISEATHIRKEDIDFGTGLVTIRGETSKSRMTRFVPLQPSTLKLIKELIKENEEDFDNSYVFLVYYGEQLTPNHFRHRLKKYAEEANLNIRVHPHLFRHTAATMFLENGGDVRHLSKIIGHRDLRMIVKYTHLSTSSIKGQHDRYSPINNINKSNKPRKIKR
jgi:integrase/recombinase XerD